MQSLDKLLLRYSKTYPKERAPFEMLEFLNEDNCYSKNNSRGHFTGSAWLVSPSRDKVLMNHHKKLNKWIQFGGHSDGEQNLLETAIREMKEETGINDYILASEDIFDVDIHFIPKTDSIASHKHFDVRFLVEVDPYKNQIYISNESINIVWVPIGEVCNYNSEDSIQRMVNKT
tara:strand:- start:390 stop:911 length:522 start_codon:yes stop_codon:yes gene_type:complete